MLSSQSASSHNLRNDPGLPSEPSWADVGSKVRPNLVTHASLPTIHPGGKAVVGDDWWADGVTEHLMSGSPADDVKMASAEHPRFHIPFSASPALQALTEEAIEISAPTSHSSHRAADLASTISQQRRPSAPSTLPSQTFVSEFEPSLDEILPPPRLPFALSRIIPQRSSSEQAIRGRSSEDRQASTKGTKATKPRTATIESLGQTQSSSLSRMFTRKRGKAHGLAPLKLGTSPSTSTPDLTMHAMSAPPSVTTFEQAASIHTLHPSLPLAVRAAATPPRFGNKEELKLGGSGFVTAAVTMTSPIPQVTFKNNDETSLPPRSILRKGSMPVLPPLQQATVRAARSSVWAGVARDGTFCSPATTTPRHLDAQQPSVPPPLSKSLISLPPYEPVVQNVRSSSPIACSVKTSSPVARSAQTSSPSPGPVSSVGRGVPRQSVYDTKAIPAWRTATKPAKPLPTIPSPAESKLLRRRSRSIPALHLAHSNVALPSTASRIHEQLSSAPFSALGPGQLSAVLGHTATSRTPPAARTLSPSGASKQRTRSTYVAPPGTLDVLGFPSLPSLPASQSSSATTGTYIGSDDVRFQHGRRADDGKPRPRSRSSPDTSRRLLQPVAVQILPPTPQLGGKDKARELGDISTVRKAPISPQLAAAVRSRLHRDAVMMGAKEKLSLPLSTSSSAPPSLPLPAENAADISFLDFQTIENDAVGRLSADTVLGTDSVNEKDDDNGFLGVLLSRSRSSSICSDISSVSSSDSAWSGNFSLGFARKVSNLSLTTSDSNSQVASGSESGSLPPTPNKKQPHVPALAIRKILDSTQAQSSISPTQLRAPHIFSHGTADSAATDSSPLSVSATSSMASNLSAMNASTSVLDFGSELAQKHVIQRALEAQKEAECQRSVNGLTTNSRVCATRPARQHSDSYAETAETPKLAASTLSSPPAGQDWTRSTTAMPRSIAGRGQAPNAAGFANPPVCATIEVGQQGLGLDFSSYPALSAASHRYSGRGKAGEAADPSQWADTSLDSSTDAGVGFAM